MKLNRPRKASTSNSFYDKAYNIQLFRLVITQIKVIVNKQTHKQCWLQAQHKHNNNNNKENCQFIWFKGKPMHVNYFAFLSVHTLIRVIKNSVFVIFPVAVFKNNGTISLTALNISKYKEIKDLIQQVRSKCFPFRLDLFSEGRQSNFDRVASSEYVSILLNPLSPADKSQICVQSCLRNTLYLPNPVCGLHRMPNPVCGLSCLRNPVCGLNCLPSLVCCLYCVLSPDFGLHCLPSSVCGLYCLPTPVCGLHFLPSPDCLRSELFAQSCLWSTLFAQSCLGLYSCAVLSAV